MVDLLNDLERKEPVYYKVFFSFCTLFLALWIFGYARCFRALNQGRNFVSNVSTIFMWLPEFPAWDRICKNTILVQQCLMILLFETAFTCFSSNDLPFVIIFNGPYGLPLSSCGHLSLLLGMLSYLKGCKICQVSPAVTALLWWGLTVMKGWIVSCRGRNVFFFFLTSLVFLFLLHITMEYWLPKPLWLSFWSPCCCLHALAGHCRLILSFLSLSVALPKYQVIMCISDPKQAVYPCTSVASDATCKWWPHAAKHRWSCVIRELLFNW